MKLILSSSIASRVVVATILAVGASLLAAGSVSARSPVGEVQRGFELVDDYLAMKDGADLDARIYSSSTTKAILIVPNDMATAAVILWPRSRVVESLKSMKVQKNAGGFVEVKKEAVAATHAPFEVVGTDVLFKVGSTNMLLKPKPPLVGLFDAPGMIDSSAVYARRATEYKPLEETVQKLGAVTDDVRVRVFFGSWCPACGQMVPRILNVAEKLDESNLEFEFYGLPRGQGFNGDLEAKKYKIESVPTGVILVNGKEVGRLQGNDWRSPEASLWKLLGS